MAQRYQRALEYLYPRLTTIKFGLDTTRRLLAALGNPHDVFATVHIGGTNGKGSVATLVADALARQGFRVGLYTSPHLVSFRERIRVNGAPITRDAVATWTEHLRPLADFAARGAEIAVVEVGLGGRLDSTNVVTPLVSAVTHIALDHMKYLGDSLEQIAREKAGIAKPGVPFVIGESNPALAALLGEAAREAVVQQQPGATVETRLVEPGRRWEGALGLAGPHQRRNAAVAEAVLDALPVRWRPSRQNVAAAFADARLPGRLDRRGRWLFDVAHNPDGVEALVAALRADPPAGPVHALVSILGDKEWPAMLVALDQVVDRGILTIAPSAEGRRWDLEWLSRWLERPDRPPAHAEWTLVPDFQQALAEASEGAGTVLVTGSFHTVGDVMAELRVES